MKNKILLITVLFISICMLSSCLSYKTYIYDENVKWQTENDRLFIFIQGPSNEHSGFSRIMINGEFIDAYVQFGGNIPRITLYLEDAIDSQTINIEQDSLIHFRMNIIDKTTIELSVEYNNTNDSFFDNLLFKIYRSNISEDELNARYYFNEIASDNIKFYNISNDMTIEHDKHTIFDGEAKGTINFNNQVFDIRIDYLDDDKFEIYDSNNNELLFSGQYISTKEYIDLILDSNDFYPSSLSSIKLEIVQPGL
ncbi:MAG: hypothetical protein K8Q99_03530 [Acholeplasmataceae bacterium]|nr:hypothetical protein [Acholeplasmataceae bacterium]